VISNMMGGCYVSGEDQVMVDREGVPSCTEVRAQSIVRDTQDAVTVVTGLDRVTGGES
jgi:hypothetical protein